MPMRRFLPALALLLSALPLSRPALAAGCPAPNDVHPHLHVEVLSDPVQYDTSKSRAALKGFGTSLASPYAPGTSTHTNGLMRGTIALQSNSGVARQSQSDGSDNCFWYDQVTVTIKLAPTIYIAREVPPDSCLYREVLAHETHHVNVDHEVAQGFQTTIQDELAQYVTQVGVAGPYAAAQKNAIQTKLNQQLNALVRSWSVRIQNERLLQQAKVDTLAEYERIARACPDEAQEAKETAKP